MPVTPATQEARSGGSQFELAGQKVCDTLAQKNTPQKKRAGRDAQGAGPDFQTQ
jgi:hypothetical protein